MSARIIAGVAVDLGDCSHWQQTLDNGGTVVHLGELALHVRSDASPDGLRKLAATLVELADARAEQGGACGVDLGPGYTCQRPAGHDGDHEPTSDLDGAA